MEHRLLEARRRNAVFSLSVPVCLIQVVMDVIFSFSSLRECVLAPFCEKTIVFVALANMFEVGGGPHIHLKPRIQTPSKGNHAAGKTF